MAITVGLVTAKSNKDLRTEQEQKDLLTSNSDQLESRLSGHIKRVWHDNRNSRVNIDKRLLYCLRSRKGEYSPTEISSIMANGGADPVFLKLTGTKCRAASSWIRDIILPAGEKPWSLKPGVEPNIPPEMLQAAKSQALKDSQELFQSGVMSDPMEIIKYLEKIRSNLKTILNDQASIAAQNMEDRLGTHMEMGGWDQAVEEFLEDFVTYPTAFFKGPYYKIVDELTWDDKFQPVVKKKTCMNWKRISPFDMYPGGQTRNLNEGSLIERIRLTSSQLYSFIGQDGYSEKEIRETLDEFESGKLQDWLWDQYERIQLETDSFLLDSNSDFCDGVHFWGQVKGDMLEEWGISSIDKVPIDKQKSYEIDAILIGTHTIRAVVNTDPIVMRPYNSACWDSVPGSIWGIALPEQMEDHQKIVNATARSLLTNMSLSAGPQITVLTDMLAPGEDVTSIYPFKIWQARSSATGNSGDPLKFFQPSMNGDALMKILDAFEQKADDVTNVPRYSYGNENISGAGSTASGLSMLLNSASKGIRRAISNIDKALRSSIKQSFIYLMLDDPDPSIKCDCDVIARGSTAILIKDQLQVRLQAFLQQTANPIDMQIIGIKGRAALLRESAKLLDLPIEDIIPSEEEIQSIQDAQKAAMAKQQQQGSTPQGGMDQGPQSGPVGPPSPIPSAQAGLPGNQMQIQQNKMQAGA